MKQKIVFVLLLLLLWNFCNFSLKKVAKQSSQHKTKNYVKKIDSLKGQKRNENSKNNSMDQQQRPANFFFFFTFIFLLVHLICLCLHRAYMCLYTVKHSIKQINCIVFEHLYTTINLNNEKVAKAKEEENDDENEILQIIIVIFLK